MENEKHFTLLLVDDNPTNLLLLVKIIELDLPEVCVLTATSAKEGLSLVENESIDGAFIDVQMPQMGGLDMCRELRRRQQTATTPLVLMTAHIASPAMRAEGLEVGAYDFISQPISNVEMLARIKVMLRLCEEEHLAQENTQQLQQQVTDHADRLRWISGLLISGNGSLGEQDQQLLSHLVNQLPAPSQIDEKLFFEKLLTEFPLSWRRTLLKLSLLDRIPMTLSQKLSEINDVTAVFDYLSRHQFSLIETLDGEDYLFLSPQVRDLLRQKVDEYLSENERKQTSLIAADWYRKKKDFSAALGCLISAKEYSAVSQLLSQVGFSLLNKKDSAQVFYLLDTVPEKVAETCGWMSLFRGVGRLQEQSIETSAWLTLSGQRFRSAGDARGELLALAQQVSQFIFLDGAFERFLKVFPIFKKLATEQLELLEPIERLKVSYALGLAELFFGEDPSAADVVLTDALAEAQQQKLLTQQLELNLLRALSALQQGRYLVARTALEHGLDLALKTDAPLESAALHVVACELLHAKGDLVGFKKQQQILSTCCSYEVQQRTVLKPLISYYVASLFLAKKDQQTALETLEIALLDGQAAGNSHLQSRLLQLRGWIRALSGQSSKALIDCDMGLALRIKAGGAVSSLENLLLAGATRFALHDYNQAAEYLAKGLSISLTLKEERLRIGIHAWMAVVQNKLGNCDASSEQVQSFFELLRRHKIQFFWGMTPDLMDAFLPLVTQGHERRFLSPLFEEQLQLVLEEDGCLLPLLKVTCMGKFQLELEGQVFDFNQVGSVLRQIFALLAIAPNHSLSIESLMGILWPESSPQKARNSFDTVHSRLRKALEESFGKRVRHDYLVLEKGILSLRHMQIDSVIFTEKMGKVRYFMQRNQFWQAEHALWKMDHLWGGEFLSGYDLDGKLPQQREQLLQTRLEQIDMLAQLLQRRQQPEEAIGFLKDGLSQDPTYDPIIRQLLLLYRKQHDHNSVASLLDGYRVALQEEEYDPEEIEELLEVLRA